MRNKSVTNRGESQRGLKGLKAISVFLVILVIINLVLFVMGFIEELVFWFIIILVAVLAYLVIPRISGNRK
ncbi:MAG: hypothetical protein R6U32_02555 [Candidatus Woesearchaeota archaeon]